MRETHHQRKTLASSHTGTNVLRRAVRSRWVQALIGLSLVAAVAVGSLTLVRRASAATYDVCPSGCAYTSINAALAAAASGATIKVGPGTYGPATSDVPVAISKSINLVGAGIGKSIINGAPASGTAISGVIAISTPSTPGNISVSGFTIEGAIVNNENDDGILMTVTDKNASDVITIKNNLFYGDTTLDPQLLADQTDSIYVAGNTATVTVTGNRFQGVFRAALIEGNPGPFYFTGNSLNLHGLYDISVNPPALYYWAQALLFLADGSLDVTSPQVVSGNVFESYGGLGVGYDAWYSGGLVGRVNNLSIIGNVFNNQGVATVDSPPFDASAIYLRGFGTTNGMLTSAVSGVTIKDNVFNLNSSTGHGYAITFRGEIGANNTVEHNVIRGGGSSRPLAGVHFMTPTGSPGVNIARNIITGFADGLNSDALPDGAQVSATQNCIMGNVTSGATVAAGTILAADHNWWGAASGPHATTNPSGTGNGANGSVTFTPFLSSPATVCAGPIAKNVYAIPNPAMEHTGFTLLGTVSDVTTGNFPIASAQYSINGGAYHAMSAKDGSFNQVTEDVRVSLGGLAAGNYTLCVRGTDTAGVTGASACTKLSVFESSSAGSSAGNPSGSDTGGATDSPTATVDTASGTNGGAGSSSSSQAAVPTPGPISVGFVSFDGGSLLPVLLAGVAVVIIAAALLFLIFGRRRRDQEDDNPPRQQWQR